MSNEVKRVKDEATGKEGAYRVVDENTVVIVDPDSLDEIMRIEVQGDDVNITRAETASDMLFNSFASRGWNDSGAVGRCVKGCTLQGRGAECVVICAITNGGEWG
ncbi:MAG: hypothetical protein H6981_02245 [Gammaproteobacteria bacterium]|nr:hypothetical protein [Gammaproteobacteria bacterium]MCP5135610.1 hypothetical protein [Gammaproteobacteria bacterium]